MYASLAAVRPESSLLSHDSGHPLCTLPDHFSVIHPDDSVGNMKIAIIVADSNNGFSFVFQFCEKSFIKILSEERILISRNLIEHTDRFIVQQRHDESKTLPLSG